MNLDRKLFIEALENIEFDYKNSTFKVTDKSLEFFKEIGLSTELIEFLKEFSFRHELDFDGIHFNCVNKIRTENLEEINKERNVIYDKRNELLDQFDKKILTFYEKIKRWAKDTAVVPVKQQACYGCFIKINDKTYAEVLKGEEIVNCLHCGRILYKGEEETAVTEA